MITSGNCLAFCLRRFLDASPDELLGDSWARELRKWSSPGRAGHVFGPCLAVFGEGRPFSPPRRLREAILKILERFWPPCGLHFGFICPPFWPPVLHAIFSAKKESFRNWTARFGGMGGGTGAYAQFLQSWACGLKRQQPWHGAADSKGSADAADPILNVYCF